jgi:hypothetical protein
MLPAHWLKYVKVTVGLLQISLQVRMFAGEIVPAQIANQSLNKEVKENTNIDINIYIIYVHLFIYMCIIHSIHWWKLCTAEKMLNPSPIIRSAWLFVSGTCAFKAFTKSM